MKRNLISILLTLWAFYSFGQTLPSHNNNNRNHKIFIGLSPILDYGRDLDDNNSFRMNYGVLPEVGINFDSVHFVSIRTGIERTFWDYTYAQSLYKWTDFFIGLNYGYVFSRKNISPIIESSFLLNREWYFYDVNGVDKLTITNFRHLELKAGLQFKIDQYIIVPSFIGRLSNNPNPPNTITINPNLNFRCILE